MHLNELRFDPNTNTWSWGGVINHDVPSGNAIAATAGKDQGNFTVVTPRDDKNIELTRFGLDTNWYICKFHQSTGIDTLILTLPSSNNPPPPQRQLQHQLGPLLFLLHRLLPTRQLHPAVLDGAAQIPRHLPRHRLHALRVLHRVRPLALPAHIPKLRLASLGEPIDNLLAASRRRERRAGRHLGQDRGHRHGQSAHLLHGRRQACRDRAGRER